MHDYYRQKLEEAPVNAAIVLGCIIGSGILLIVAAALQH
jgi:hypothetical protein